MTTTLITPTIDVGHTGDVNSAADATDVLSTPTGSYDFAYIFANNDIEPTVYGYFEVQNGLSPVFSQIAIGFNSLSIATDAYITGVAVLLGLQWPRPSGDTANLPPPTDIGMRVQLICPSNPVGGGGNNVMGTQFGYGNATSPIGVYGSTWTGTNGPFSQADVNNMQVQLTVSPPGTPPYGPSTWWAPEMRVYYLGLGVNYQLSPDVFPSLSNGALPGGIPSTSPLFYWRYQSPEGIAQAGYRVVVFTQAQCAEGGFDINDTAGGFGIDTPPPYDSGYVQSGGTQATVPWGSLDGFVPYRAFVFVSDLNTNGRLGTLINTGSTTTEDHDLAGAENCGIDFSIQGTEPTLMPGLDMPQGFDPPYSPANPFIGPISARARLNILDRPTADNRTNGTAALGSWSAGTPGYTGGQFAGAGYLTLNGVAHTAAYECNPGDVLTAQVKVPGSGYVGMAFYSDVAGTSIIDSIQYSPEFVAGSGTLNRWCTCRAPAGTASVRMYVNNATSQNARCPSLTIGCLNLIDDPSFESGGENMWNLGGSSAFSEHSDTDTWHFSQWALSIPATDTAETYCVLPIAVGDVQFTVAGDINTAGAVTFGLKSGGTTSPASISFTPGAGYHRVSMIANGSDFSSSDSPLLVCTPADDCYLDNVTVEMVWPFVNGDFETGSGVLPSVSPFGFPDTQAWMQSTIDDGAVYDSTHVNTGSQSCMIDGVGGFEQYFTVAGFTSIAPSFWWYGASPEAAAYLQFFDNSGLALNPTATENGLITLGVTTANGAATVTSPAITVPGTAAFARIFFTNTADAGSIWVDTVVLPLVGTVAPSNPYLDGGWSGGGQYIIYQIQRSPDGVTDWTGVRVPPYSTDFYQFPDQFAYLPSAKNDWQMTVDDYEYPGGLYGAGASVFYYVQNINWLGVVPAWQAGNSSQRMQVAMEESGFTPTEWWLCDVFVPSNSVKLQVKDFSADQAENQTTFMPVGRGRKVVIGDSLIFGETVHLKLQTVLPSEKLPLMNLYQQVYPLVLRSAEGDYWPVRLTKRNRARQWVGSYQKMLATYTIDAEEVDQIP